MCVCVCVCEASLRPRTPNLQITWGQLGPTWVRIVPKSDCYFCSGSCLFFSLLGGQFGRSRPFGRPTQNQIDCCLESWMGGLLHCLLTC